MKKVFWEIRKLDNNDLLESWNISFEVWEEYKKELESDYPWYKYLLYTKFI